MHRERAPAADAEVDAPAVDGESGVHDRGRGAGTADRQPGRQVAHDGLAVDGRGEVDDGRELEPPGHHDVRDRDVVGERPAGGGAAVRHDQPGDGVQQGDRPRERVGTGGEPTDGVGDQAPGQHRRPHTCRVGLGQQPDGVQGGVEQLTLDPAAQVVDEHLPGDGGHQGGEQPDDGVRVRVRQQRHRHDRAARQPGVEAQRRAAGLTGRGVRHQGDPADLRVESADGEVDRTRRCGSP